MALQVSADAIRALIPDGVYSLQVLEQREKQRVVLTFILTTRDGGHSLQIETTEAALAGLFQCLLTTASLRKPPVPRARAARPRALGPPVLAPQLAADASTDGERPPAAKRRMRRAR
jgi:hypothetical protein